MGEFGGLITDTYDKVVRIPKKIKIAGYDYTVVSEVGIHNERCADDPAAMTPRSQMIWIDSKQTPDGQISSLFHEIIEALNYHYQLGLKHNVISILETSLYQVMKDNRFINIQEEKKHVKRKSKKGANSKTRIQKLGAKK